MTRPRDADGETPERVTERLRRADRLSTVAKVASSIGHELGTPLNVVSGRAMMIQMDDTASDEVKNNARIIAEQANEMAAIIRRLLEFARREAPELDDVAVLDVVERAAQMLGPIADASGVRFDIDVDASLRARLDPNRALQVLTSLIMNGIQAMPNGGALTIDADWRHIATPPDRRAVEGDYVLLRVSDEGVGIDEQALDHIFEPFLVSAPEGRRCGMALSMCHGIVREHGGWIEVASEPDKGSAFTVYLPKGSGKGVTHG